jgi:hypothetical protein
MENKGNSIRAMMAKKGMNKLTGKETASIADFDKANYGNSARQHLVSIWRLHSSSWDEIINKACEFAKARDRGGNTTSATPELVDFEDDHRALLVDVSDDDDADDEAD